jgi:DNA-binding response OmpR family regulator
MRQPPANAKPSAGKILVAEDNDDTRAVVVEILRHAGYRLIEAADGASALRRVEEESPDLAIIDINMPEVGGFSVVPAMRRRGFEQPVLILTGYSEIDSRVKGLGLGADDYMTKPFDDRELCARVAALLRRVKRAASGPQVLTFGDVVVNLENKTALRGGTPVPLTPTEYSVLELLSREMGKPVTRERMLDIVWGYDYLPNTRTVETTIWRLRKKLGDPGNQGGWIQSRSGLGYVLVLPGENGAATEPAPRGVPAG